MKKYKDFILEISKLLLINFLVVKLVDLIVSNTSKYKPLEKSFALLVIIMGFVFLLIISIRKTKLLLKNTRLFNSKHIFFNKKVISILLIEYVIIRSFVYMLDKCIKYYNSEYVKWKYEELLFIIVAILISLLICGSTENDALSEELDEYEGEGECIEGNKFINKKLSKGIIIKVIITMVVLSVTYWKVLDKRFDVIFNKAIVLYTEEEVVEMLKNRYNIEIELEKTIFDKKTQEYTHILKVKNNRTLKVKQVLERNPDRDDRLTYSIKYNIIDICEKEL